MPGLLFSAANAALVAYGEVKNLGTSGVTTIIGTVDSGVGQFTVTRLDTGKVQILLPTGFGQADGRSLLFCQGYSLADCSFGIDVTGSQQKTIYTYAAGTLADIDFGFMLFENTLPHP